MNRKEQLKELLFNELKDINMNCKDCDNPNSQKKECVFNCYHLVTKLDTLSNFISEDFRNIVEEYGKEYRDGEVETILSLYEKFVNSLVRELKKRDKEDI